MANRSLDIKVVLVLAAALMTATVGDAQTLRTDPAFHDLAMPDSKLDLAPFAAYVVGIEKANRGEVGVVRECRGGRQDGSCLNFESPHFSPSLRQKMREITRAQIRPTFVSHITKFSGAAGAKPCFLYNVYSDASPCDTGTARAQPKAGEYVSSGWDALTGMESEIARDLETRKPTHIVVYIMGWNTPQAEAIENYRKLFGSLTDATKEKGTEFRPLFIGITWPSTGSPTAPMTDYGVKAKDADEVGMIWGNLLINRVLASLKTRYDLPVVVVGHSFGARASSRAVFSAPLVTDAPRRGKPDLLLGLQGAYSFQRYVPGRGDEGSPYGDFAGAVGKVVLTSSTHDTAVSDRLHRNFFVGSAFASNRTGCDNPSSRDCRGYGRYFEHATTDASGRLPGTITCERSKVLWVDASSVIRENQPGTGGGAHSDIYDLEVGRLTAQLIAACAPAQKEGRP